MNKLFASGLVAAAVALSVSAAQTLPIWSGLTRDGMALPSPTGAALADIAPLMENAIASTMSAAAKNNFMVLAVP
jgi:hypothetical protein